MHHSKQQPEACTVADIVDSYGEWTALAVSQLGDKKEYLVLGDQSGFAPIFYALLPGKAVIVSDTFSGAVQGFERLGGVISLNAPHYLTLISGKSNTFRNLISHETMANEINVLPYDSALYINHETASFVDRNLISAAQNLDDYNKALDYGIEFARGSIQRLVAASPHATPAITLTGGADSRAVFAILLGTGLAKEFGLWTIDPRGRTAPYQKRVYTADVEIANELRQYYDLHWMPPRRREKISVSYEESLAYHQSYNSNFAFTFGPSKAVAYNTHPILTLRGGGGEVLRGSVGARMASSKFAEHHQVGGELHPADWVVDHYLDSSFIVPQGKQQVYDYFKSALSHYTGDTLRQQIDAFYRATRNRGHFGHARKSAAANDYLMQVLTNPYLIRASEMMDYNDKITGKIVVDILDRTEPKLRTFPFENVTTSQQIMDSPKAKFTYANKHGWQTDYDRMKRENQPTQFRFSWEPGARGEHWNFQNFDSDLAFLQSGFSKILDFAEHEQRDVLEDQQKLTFKRQEERAIPVGSVSSKIASVLDVFEPMELDQPGRHYFTNASNRLIPASNYPQTLSAKYTF